MANFASKSGQTNLCRMGLHHTSQRYVHSPQGSLISCSAGIHRDTNILMFARRFFSLSIIVLLPSKGRTMMSWKVAELSGRRVARCIQDRFYPVANNRSSAFGGLLHSLVARIGEGSLSPCQGPYSGSLIKASQQEAVSGARGGGAGVCREHITDMEAPPVPQTDRSVCS